MRTCGRESRYHPGIRKEKHTRRRVAKGRRKRMEQYHARRRRGKDLPEHMQLDEEESQ